MAISDKIGTGAKTIAKKTKEVAQVSKLNAMIASEEKNIEDSIYKIGSIYFEKYTDTNLLELTPICMAICESKKKINEYEIEIKAVRGIKTCKNCNNELEEGTLFCPKCGARVEG